MDDENGHPGASNNERLLAAARTDNEELLLEVFDSKSYDINFRDGLGNTALHYAAQYGATTVLELILESEGCDVDLQNRLEHDTPLHAGLKNLDDPELRNHVIESLLDAGANTKIKDKNGNLPIDLVSSSSTSLDDELRGIFRRLDAEAKISMADIVHEDDYDGGYDTDSDDV